MTPQKRKVIGVMTNRVWYQISINRFEGDPKYADRFAKMRKAGDHCGIRALVKHLDSQLMIHRNIESMAGKELTR